MVTFIRSDLDFILQQIVIAERNAAGEPLADLLPNLEVPFGLRTVTGEFNNLVHPEFGAADLAFPRLTTPSPFYSTTGTVFDPQPRTISNLIVDQTTNNPAAVAAAAANPGASIITSPGIDGVFGTADDVSNVNYIPNITADAGLSAPFNSWMTFFGQFFDHGLDLLTKSNTEFVFIPLQPDDPILIANPNAPPFMILQRAAGGGVGTNTTSPFVDQSQTYSSHPSHQVFLRAYELDANGHPVATGGLLTNRNLGADGKFGGIGADADTDLGGMSTWAIVKAQARDLLGINLTDADIGDVPLLATDAYGNFIRGANGFPQVILTNGTLIEGNPAANGGLGISLANAVHTGHAFLNDIAHNADPTGGKTADADNVVSTGPLAAGTYDDELLNAHYIAGDGRVNENIGLTAVHAVFHSEHNRLVQHTKDVALSDAASLLAGGATQAQAVAFLNQWLSTDVTTVPVTAGDIAALHWDGERLFQAAKFGTEMQYQHLVFEEFARTVQPNVDGFLAPNGYDVTINPAILAEFAHTVYRFGHSMLTETVDRLDPNFNPVNSDPQLGLIAAFLNPLAYAASGVTAEQATGAIVRGVTRQVGNEIDEFVTEALRNNLLGLPLDLPALNIARGRDTGIPSLNEARREFYAATGDTQLKPYISWVDMLDHLKHPESLINFIAAYGTHASITSETTIAGKRAAATLLVLGGTGEPIDRLAFLTSTGAYANLPNDATITGVDDIDFWVGGLAEEKMPFGGMLGSTFNFVFETQLENLQNGDRFYYLSRTAGLHFGTELENNSFAKLVIANSDATHLPNAIFSTPTWTLEVDQTKQYTGLGATGRDDPTGGIMINGVELTKLVIRDNPNTTGPDARYLKYTGEDHVVLGGTALNDTIISGDGDDTIYGDAGNDRLEGGAGNDVVLGGAGDDILSDSFGDNRLEGGDGNDVIVVGSMSIAAVGNLILGGRGQDFIITTEDISTTFGGEGDDFILGAKTNLPPTGNEGDDWIEFGTQDGAPGDNFAPLLADNVVGNDIFIGGGGFDEMIGEGGDDIFTGSDAQDKYDGNSGFDWVTYKNDRFGVTVDLTLAALAQPHGNAPNQNTGVFSPVGASPASILDRFAEVEGLSGSKYGDILKGDNVDAITILTHGAAGGGALTNVALINGLQQTLAAAGLSTTGFATGNIILGGDGSDIIEGRGGDDLIDGDKWLNVKINVYALGDVNHTGAVLRSVNSMVDLIPDMLSGTINPGQLHAVREIVEGTPNLPGRADNFDTAVFTGLRADYTIAVNTNGTATRDNDIFTVTDTVVGRDGTDTLTHIERLQFADIALVRNNAGNFVNQANFAGGANAAPVGLATIVDSNGGAVTVGDTITVSMAGVTDANNIVAVTNPTGAINRSVSFYWQFEATPGTGIFEDIILLPAGDLAFQSADGSSFKVTPDLAGLSLRVKAIYQDAHGVTETVFSAPTASVVASAAPAAAPALTEVTAGGEGIHLAASDLQFILDQIKIAEANAHGVSILSLIPNVRSALGLRTVDGSFNNLVQLNGIDQSEFGAADNTFPRVVPAKFINDADGDTFDPDGPGPAPTITNTNYATSSSVVDADPRTISNLIVDQTAKNAAAYATAYNPGLNGTLDFGVANNDDVLKDGVEIVKSPGLDGQFGTADDRDVFLFPNVAPDAGLSAPFNSWFTFFGQFFDHGLDLVTKGGNGTIYIPLEADDPLIAGADGIFGNSDDLPASQRFMVLTRATQVDGPGADGKLGTADDTHHEAMNTTSPFVDQNQTYSSHPSHQVFLRAYEVFGGAPVATGKLITNRDLGADGKFGTLDDHELGGMATWGVVKAQARDVLGINLTDADFDNVPLLATDAYGNFIKGAHGYPMVVFPGNVLVEGNPLTPVNLAGAIRTGHAFLNDIANNAVPVFAPGGGADGIARTADDLIPDTDNVAGNVIIPNAQGRNPVYDNELLNAHYIAGDGRVNENIGLTAVHSIFHSEHNRLVNQTKDTVLGTGNLAFINEWLLAPIAALPANQAQIDALHWNGERLFQAGKFGTEMQYQHLVFEEFARTIQPNVDLFFAPTQVYDADLDASIVAEFAHTVYRFGHSMLTETVDRYDANFNVIGSNPANPDQQLGLIEAFLNPLAFVASGATPEDATSAIVRGVTRQVGNEIDEFVTEALRSNLLGLPLDLPALNIARGRDTGIPSLNEVRRDIYRQTGNSDMKPYVSWVDLIEHLKHPESVINFIAAYGTHASFTGLTTLAAKRAAATLLVLGDGNDADGVTIGGVTYNDRLDFLNSTGVWANVTQPGRDGVLGTADDLRGVTITGLDQIDLWIGGLAEEKNPFGGMLGSTFNFIFENQLEKLQDGDRFYYLERTAGLAFNAELESNSFAKLIMANTTATHLPAIVFLTPAYTLEVDQSKQFTGLGADGRADPTDGNPLIPLVIRDNPETAGADTNYLQYTGPDHVVLGGTAGNDILVASEGDDTIWGDAGNDRIEGGYGNDQLRGGAGDDIITDLGGDDNIQGGDGNDVIQGGNGVNLIIGGFGNDFIITGEDASEAIGGQGNDFILGSKANEQDMGNEGDDWIEKGTSDGAPGDNFDPLGNDTIIGNDVFIGDGENDKFNAEGGDDIMVGKTGFGDRYIGGSGFDWADFKDDPTGVYIDISDRFFDQPAVPGGTQPLARFDIVEGLSGSHKADYLLGDDETTLVNAGATGSVLTNFALIDGLEAMLGSRITTPVTGAKFFDGGNIILGGEGGDIIQGRGGDDFIDGDAWLNVRIGVFQNIDGSGGQIYSADSMTDALLMHNMLNGVWNPGQLKIVREIKYSATADFDTANFTGNLADYTITIADQGTADTGDDVVTVADNNVAPRDGTDTLKHIERLQFADQALVRSGAGFVAQSLAVGTGNHAPTGTVSILDAATLLPDLSPSVGQTLRVNVSGVRDADNTATGGVIPNPVAYFWQADLLGTGVFEDIVGFAAGEVARTGGPTLTITPDLDGVQLRVRAVYRDAHGVLEEVYSTPTFPVGNEPPVLAGPITLAAINEDPAAPLQILAATLLAGSFDPEGLPLTALNLALVTPADGTVTDLGGGVWQFVPAANFNGTVNFTFDVSDGVITIPSTASLVVNPVNDIPTGVPTAVLVAGTEDQSYTVSAAALLQGFTDVDGDTLSIGTLTASNGIVTRNAGGTSFTVTPALNFNGPVTLTYSVIDGHGGILPGQTRTYNVAPANDTATQITLSVSRVAEFAATNTVIGTLAANDPDTGDVLTFQLLDNAGGRFQIVGNQLRVANGVALDFEQNISHTISVQVSDGSGIPFTQTLTIGVNNVDPERVVGTAAGETIIGGALDDRLDGNGGDDILIGRAGSDRLDGGAGNDRLVATVGDGNDRYTGGAGVDTYDLSQTTAAATVNLANGTSTSAQTGTDRFDGGIENVIGSQGGDTITGDGAANRLSGLAGADTINGGAGADVIIGGTGNDVMTGGAGLDLFVFEAGFGNDRIADFDANAAGGQDLIDLSALGITSLNYGSHVFVTDLGADLLVTIDTAATTIRLTGVANATDIDRSDFILFA